MGNILLVSSNVHKTLSARQLEKCVDLVKKSNHQYQIATIEAGTYEIPFVINTYHKIRPFDGYIALGLVLKSNIDHFNYIMSHISESFTYFALHDIVVGNGIISGMTTDELTMKLDSEDPCMSAFPSAFKAVDALIELSINLTKDNILTG